jgi:pimeloyl-ACP methyl ester carboxylesterase
VPDSAASRRTVLSGGTPLACLDHGGTGPDLVLMHGAGMKQGSLGKLVAHLTPRHRVVTFDFRGHGDSGGDSWTIGTAVTDLVTVIDAFGLDKPAVGGHSLGGMVAAAYATEHPECPGAVNLDGHGTGKPDQYVGKDPERVAEWIVQAHARGQKVVDSPFLSVVRFLARLRGRPLANRDVVRQITGFVQDLDMREIYKDARCPLLVVSAYAPFTGLPAKVMKDPEQMLTAYRAGIRRDLAAIAAANPLVELAEIDATHSLITTHPEQTAALVLDFLAPA